MYQEERLFEIINRLKKQKVMSNKEIMDAFGISRDTARRDIVKLVESGSAIRTHGGIAVPSIQNEVKEYKNRILINSEEKLAIGEQASKYLTEDQMCFFDVSTTVQSLCQFVNSDISIYTHSLDNLEYLSDRGCDVHLLGGKLQTRNRFLHGSETIARIEQLYFDVAFLGAAAVKEDGIYCVDEEDAFIKAKVCERAAMVIVLVDHEKFFKSSRYKVIPFEKIDVMLTSKEPPEPIGQKIRQSGARIEIIEEE